MSDSSALLLLMDALSRVSERGIHVPDLQAQIRRAVSAGAIPDRLKQYDSSQLFVLLQQLIAKGLVARTRHGYELTEEGKLHTDELRHATEGGVIEGLAEAARNVA